MKILALTLVASAQSPAADPGDRARFGRAIKARDDTITCDIVDAAEAMPESESGFRATPWVRTFAEIVGARFGLTVSHQPSAISPERGPTRLWRPGACGPGYH